MHQLPVADRNIAGIAHDLAGVCAVTEETGLYNEFVSLELAAEETDPDTRSAITEILSELQTRQGLARDQIDPASTM